MLGFYKSKDFSVESATWQTGDSVTETVENKSFSFSRRLERVCYALIFLGVLGFVLGLLWRPERAWANFLLNGFYVLTLSLSGVLFAAIQYVSHSRWSEVLRRIPEAMMSYLPVGGALLLFLFFGAHSLYHWTHAEVVSHDAVLSGKASYLNLSFFFLRVIFFILVWSLFAKIFRRNSLRQDETGDFSFYKKNVKFSVGFIIFYALSFSFFSYDLIMSLEPHWFSTIFAVYNFSGMLVNGFVVITLIALFLREKGYFPQFTNDHLHDLAKYIFAFSVFWTYIWFSQVLLIWYANIPEETIYFYNRFHGGFQGIFYLNVIMNFAVPFFVLMTRNAKRNPKVVKGICLWLLVGRWVDLYQMIWPGVLGTMHHSGQGSHETSMITILEFLIPCGFIGVFLFVVFKALEKAPLLPKHSPLLQESLSHHQ